MRAVSYGRVSSREQVEGYSLDAQDAACAKLIGERGWQHVRAYRDEALSAKTTERADFQRMMDEAKRGEFDVIVVHKMDRFTRSLIDALLTLRELDQYKVTVVSVTEPFDFTSMSGKIMLVVIVLFAEWYLSNLATEVAKGKRERAEQGGWSNRLSFGYTAKYKVEGGDGLAIPDDNAEGVVLMFTSYRTGKFSLQGVADLTNDAGYRPTGRAGERSLKLWTKDAVAFVLKNRFYVGEVMYRGEWYPGAHEPIISRELFDEVQEMLEHRRRVPRFKARRDSRVYLLAGLSKCARCGSNMRGHYKVDRGTEYLYYKCSARARGLECDQRHVPAPIVEEAMGTYLCGFAFPDSWRADLLQDLEVAPADSSPEPDLRPRLETRLARLKDLYLLNDIDKPTYLRQRDELQAQIDALAPSASAAASDLTEAVALLNNMEALWNAATPAERKELVRSFIKTVRLDADEGLVSVEPRPEVAVLFRSGSHGFLVE
jgi:DNA invertase Pin-like site-specific DNA recombinase